MPTIDIDATPSGAGLAHAEYLEVDPKTLVLDENIRTNPVLTAGFLADIAENGVENAIECRRDPLGQLLVIDGQCRTLAAIKADLQAVPVKIVDGIGDAETRITRQYRLNEQRAPLTAAQKVAAVEQLTLFGRTPKAIARKLHANEAEVAAALAVAQSKTAKAAIVEPEIDLQAAATIAEFEDDQAIVDELRKIAVDQGRGALEHRAEQRRQERARAAAVAALKAELVAAGVNVLDQPAFYLKGNKHEDLANLAAKPWKGSGPYPTALKAEKHATCPGHAVYVREAYGRDGGEGLAVALPYCLDWKANGHYRRLRPHRENPGVAEDASATEERRHVVAQNKASDAAREVRKRWLVELLTIPKMLPKDAGQHAAAMIASDRSAVSDYGVSQVLDDLLGEKYARTPDIVQRAERTPAGGTWYVLALALAIGEHRLPRDFWRQPAKWAAQRADHVAVRHLTQLAKWGYTLSEIEQAYVDAYTATIPAATDGGTK